MADDPVEDPRGDGGRGDEGERRYRHLVETSPAPINLFDAEGTCIWGNDAVLDLLGLGSREELVGRSIFEFVHTDDHETAKRELRAVVEEKRSIGPTQMTLVRDDGEHRHIQVATAPGTYEGRDIGQAVVVDVTPLRETERELREERQFVQGAVDALEDVFFVVGPSGELRRWNERAEAVTGHDGEALADMQLGRLVAEEDVDSAFESIATVLETGQDTVDLAVRTADGRTIPYEFRCRRLDGPSESPPDVVGIGRDVSEQRERERQLRHFEQILRHNIRTELTLVLGLAEEIERGEAEEVRANARRIRQRGEALFEEANTVKQLVSMLTRPPETVEVDLAAVARESATATRRRHANVGVDVEAPDTAPVVALPRIGDALAELLENAVVHSDRETPSLSVTVERSGETCTLAVADDGPGIPREEREILTGDREIHQLQHGSGTGLWFVYWIVRLSEGEVRFGDEDPRGSVVYVELHPAE